MVETEFDRPEPIELRCPICRKPKMVQHYWWALSERWIHAPPFHDACLDKYRAARNREPEGELLIPAKFREPFEESRFRDQKAFYKATGFCPEEAKRVFAIIGLAGRGKSRLCWHVIKGFVAELRARTGFAPELEAYSWADVTGDSDPYSLQRIRNAKYLYLSDIGSTEAFGRTRAILQAHIRYRIQRNSWTWLCVDDLRFDEDLGRILKNETYCVWIDT